jgi:hypothetical protein
MRAPRGNGGPDVNAPALVWERFGGYDGEENCMETRIFDRPVTVLSTDGKHSETFSRGERVMNIRRIGKRVMFEPVNTRRVAGTYAMDWSEFEANTTAVREAPA